MPSAPITSVSVTPNAVQAPSGGVVDPGTELPIATVESKPFPWMWVGIGAAGLIAVWYFFLREK